MAISHSTLAYLVAGDGRDVDLDDRTTGAAILALTYGYQAESHDDRMLGFVERAMRAAVLAITPGSFIADWIPACELHLSLPV